MAKTSRTRPEKKRICNLVPTPEDSTKLIGNSPTRLMPRSWAFPPVWQPVSISASLGGMSEIRVIPAHASAGDRLTGWLGACL